MGSVMLRRCLALPAAFIAALLFGSSSCGDKEFTVRTYQMGDRVALGHLIYIVFDSQWLTQIGEDTSARIPQNRFFLVHVSVTNSGGDKIVAPTLTLEDGNGGGIPELSNGEGVPQWIGYLRQINPAESAQGNLVFDVPPKRYKLRVTDEEGDHAALVDIPLNFGNENPDIPNPDQTKNK